ncbi:MAG: hypothetical protein DI629_07250 [Mesorhizobium amorphae]|nr:MAG: hypothetical protein DI629_07250 [Mesorhizobium amorphae]
MSHIAYTGEVRMMTKNRKYSGPLATPITAIRLSEFTIGDEQFIRSETQRIKAEKFAKLLLLMAFYKVKTMEDLLFALADAHVPGMRVQNRPISKKKTRSAVASAARLVADVYESGLEQGGSQADGLRAVAQEEQRNTTTEEGAAKNLLKRLGEARKNPFVDAVHRLAADAGVQLSSAQLRKYAALLEQIPEIEEGDGERVFKLIFGRSDFVGT